jgi:hypothetical protein
MILSIDIIQEARDVDLMIITINYLRKLGQHTGAYQIQGHIKYIVQTTSNIQQTHSVAYITIHTLAH